MPKVEQWIIDKVKDAADIVDVVGDFVELRKVGVNYTGLCPFHDDKTDGNFIVRPKTASTGANTYHCFVCMRKGEGGGPVDFLMKHEYMSFMDAIRWLGKKYSIEVDNVPLNYTPPPPRPKPVPPPPMVMERKWVKQLMGNYNQNTFTLWYGRLPWNEHQRKMMKTTLWQYCVGCYFDGRVVFWYIDHEGIPRSAKLMSYLPDGHRDKERNPGWLYNQTGYRDTCKPDEHTVLKPLFGSHLLKRYPNANINVVESEKTALIMANYFGQPENQLWLACGGLKHLNIDSMQPLIDQGRRVWLWPDKDGVDGWQEVADKLGSDQVQVYTKFFDACWESEDGDKADIADIAIRMLYHPDWVPREIKKDGEHVATENNAEAASDHGATSEPSHGALNSDEPFLDPEVIRDPRILEWRQKLHAMFNFRKHHLMPTTDIEGVHTIGEILTEHPYLNQIIDEDE